MQTVYVSNNFIFKKKKDAIGGGAYFTIIHPDGRYLDYSHYFSNESQIKEWIKKRIH